MQFTDIFRLASMNLHADPKNSRRIIAGLCFAFLLILSTVSVWLFTIKFETDFNCLYKNEAYLYNETADTIVNDLTSETSTLISLVPAVSNPLPAYSLGLVINEYTYYGRNYTIFSELKSQSLVRKDSSINIGAYTDAMNSFPETLGNYLISGSSPKNPGEIMLSDYILSVFDVSTDYASLVGMPISLILPGEQGEQILISHYIISGIFSSAYLDTREGGFISDSYVHHIYVNLLSSDKHLFKQTDSITRIYFSDYNSLASVTGKNLPEIIKNDFRLKSNDAEFTYHLTTNGIMYSTISWIIDNVFSLLLIIAVCCLLAVLANIVYIYHFFRLNRKGFNNMLFCLGLSSKNRLSLTLCEVMYCTAIAFFIAAYFMTILILILNFILSTSIGFSIF